MRLKFIISTVFAFVLLPAAISAAESHCQNDFGEDRANTPSNHFSENGGNGTITHRRTGLTWARCAVGQSWNDGSCEGRALVYQWPVAMEVDNEINGNGGLAGYEDWRLPTREELATIVEQCREDPAINVSIFPDTPSTGFWTSTVEDEDEGMSWFVGFFQGLDYPYRQDSAYRVRLVRGGD